MAAVSPLPGLVREPDEQRMLLRDVVERVRDPPLMDRPGLRMTYLEGALELMSPSPEHVWKRTSRGSSNYSHVMGIDLYGYGSTIFKKE